MFAYTPPEQLANLELGQARLEDRLTAWKPICENLRACEATLRLRNFRAMRSRFPHANYIFTSSFLQRSAYCLHVRRDVREWLGKYKKDIWRDI